MIDHLKNDLTRWGIPDTRRARIIDAMRSLHDAVSMCDPVTRSTLYQHLPAALELADEYGRRSEWLRADFVSGVKS